jgi:hypothetical protein
MAGGQPGADETIVAPPWWQRAFASQHRETKRVVAEMMAVRGMMPLLMKVRNGGSWTAQEKRDLLAHLRRVAHLSPYLLLLVLPGSVVFLPAYAWWLDRRRGQR